MNLTKLEVATMLLAFVKVNDEQDILDLLGIERIEKLSKVFIDIADNTTSKENRETVANLLNKCVDYLLDEGDDLPTRLEGSD